uniref:Uncharacterized protein n=1 Tax=Amphimedon queenslandica TaxID=400682 RepID=A0A1X7SSJ2_AMPQE
MYMYLLLYIVHSFIIGYILMCVSLMHQDMRLLILYSDWLMDLMMVLYYQQLLFLSLFSRCVVARVFRLEFILFDINIPTELQ